MPKPLEIQAAKDDVGRQNHQPLHTLEDATKHPPYSAPSIIPKQPHLCHLPPVASSNRFHATSHRQPNPCRRRKATIRAAPVRALVWLSDPGYLPHRVCCQENLHQTFRPSFVPLHQTHQLDFSIYPEHLSIQLPGPATTHDWTTGLHLE